MIPMAMLGLKDSPLQRLMPEMNWMHPSSCVLSHHIYFFPHRLTSGAMCPAIRGNKVFREQIDRCSDDSSCLKFLFT
ncbi:hypothetical protein I7I53_07553 [Histoplasma capsulatum var. duboisii H88]|uniref:Uncharacterized protein n=1 Tax=Ajellomyces capsulatus (strain H88) TaxID=544711 RepID=A0A8A1LHW3_AJEC8|nr:hypothetical protein I7I53_07553 [Histoplasma capsulatum var. duboisii H88]